MTPDEGALRSMVDRDLRSPSDKEFVAARERVLDHLRDTPVHRRAVDVPPVERAGLRRFPTRPWALAAAVALVMVAIGGAIVWPRGARVYAAGADGLQVTLADDSRVEMRARAEMTVGRAPDGIQIDLKTGDIIVTAAEQRDGHLYVRTKDMTVAVDGTVFLVNAGEDGSRVAVIEGEVRVRERGTPLRRSGRPGDVETRLRSGEQLATSPTIVRRPLTEGITWSRNAAAHLAVLDSKRIATATLAPIAAPGQATPGQGAVASDQVARTEFEEASIRVCDPNSLPPGSRGGRGASGANFFRMTPGRTYGTCLTLATLVRTAFGDGLVDGPGRRRDGPSVCTGDPTRGEPCAPRRLPDPRDFSGIPSMAFREYFLGVEDGLRVRGGPDWVRGELYTIEAVTAGQVDAQTMRGPLLRALLERRFGLRVHTETEQIPAMRLTVAPGGLKMKEGTCVKSEMPPGGGQAAQSVAAVRRNLDAARRGETTSGRCGQAGALNGPNMLIVGAGFGVQPLGEGLAEWLGVPILDQTGIPETALFNYVLEFVPDDSLSRGVLDWIQAGSGELQIASDPSAVPRAPGIFTALEEQLGLRLERARAPRDFIVIDQVERPSPN